MGRIAELYALQELDLTLDARRSRLAQVEERMGEDEGLLAARRAWEESQEAHHRLVARQREQEWDLQEIERRIGPEEKKLYGGSIVNPRELQGLQEEVASLRRQKRPLEDRLLAAMLEADEAHKALLQAREELHRQEERWRREQAALEAEAQELRQEMERRAEQRAQQGALVEPDLLARYELLRERRQGRAVAKVERGLCGGCRIALPTGLLQQVRFSTAPVQCTSCERILYLS